MTRAQKDARRPNKPQYDGHQSETGVFGLLRRRRFRCWDLPGQRSDSLTTGGSYRADIAGFDPALAAYGVRQMPNALLRAFRKPANYLIEVKSQYTPGSAERKIVSAIEDLASAADQFRIVPVLIMDTPVFKENVMTGYRDRCEKSLVVFFTAGDLQRRGGQARLRAEMIRIAKARRALYTKLDPRTGDVKPRVNVHTGTAAAAAVVSYIGRHNLRKALSQ